MFCTRENTNFNGMTICYDCKYCCHIDIIRNIDPKACKQISYCDKYRERYTNVGLCRDFEGRTHEK